MRSLFLCFFIIFCWTKNLLATTEYQRDLLNNSVYVLEEILESPDFGIPETLLGKANSIIIFPTMIKGGFIFGVRYGRGVASSRNKETGEWSAPSFVETVGGSLGFQIGAEAVDLILLVMNEWGIEAWLKNQLTLGGDVGVAAGPVGRHAEASTDFKMQAGILSYSRSKGAFAGISLKGTVVNTDTESNQVYYGEPILPQDILLNGKITKPPESALRFMKRLNRLAPPVRTKKQTHSPQAKEVSPENKDWAEN